MLALLLPTLVVLSAFSSLQVAAKEEWITVRSRNFTLVGNASEREIRRIATELEQFRAAFGRLFAQARLQSTAPTRVVVFRNDGAFRPFKPMFQGKPGAVSGYFLAGTDVNYIALTAETRQDRPYGVIFHEFVHALTRNNARNAPLWFSEGLAEYYSTFEALDSGKRILLGKPIANHVYYLRDQQIIPLKTLFAVNHGSPHYNEREKKGVFYAQSWALVHFFMQGDEGARRTAFNRYLTLLAAGTPIEESFRQAFKTDFVTLERDLRNYISRKQYSFDEFTLGDRLAVDSTMEAAPLSEAESQYYLGDLLLHMQRLEEAETYLQQAITLDDKLGSARASLGILRMRQKRFPEAREHLAVAAQSTTGTGNSLAHYYYAWTVSRESMGSDNVVSGFPAESIQLMRTQLKKAIELAPEFAEAYRLLAFVLFVEGKDLKEAENLSRRAQALAPGEGEYGYLLAQILLRDMRFAEAKAILEPIATGGAEEGLRSRAQAMLERVEAEMARRAGELENPVTQPPAARSTSGKIELNPPPAAPRLRRRVDGEEQVEGLLVNIDCGRELTLTVKVEERLVRLRAASMEAVQFVSFTPGVGTKITCGAQKAAGRVRVTYRPVSPGKASGGVDGEPVTVEFVK
ncbi:MAG: hypothetical protein ABI882_12495 [Acidobacteriota bacterium]